MTKMHLTSPSYKPWAACETMNRLPTTENISEVTCRRCLNLFAPPRTLEELRAAVIASIEPER